jgi:hypothetical protein
MAALEDSSVGQNITPFAEFLARLVDDGIKGKSVPKVYSQTISNILWSGS